MLADRPPSAASAAEVIEQTRLDAARGAADAKCICRRARRRDDPARSIDPSRRRRRPSRASPVSALDVVFPVLHGPYGEDGTVQGLLELANVAYVGCGVLASAVGMDKARDEDRSSRAQRPARAPTTSSLLRHEWRARQRGARPRSPQTLGFPLFVKPANLGSSVGISKAKTRDELAAALELAAAFDRKSSSRRPCRTRARSSAPCSATTTPEASVAGRDRPVARVLRLRGEVPRRRIAARDSCAARRGADARGPPAGARRRSSAIDGAGLARVDFLLARETGGSSSTRSTRCPA